MVRLSRMSFSGWKQFRQVENFEPGNLNVFIGVNGSGKSNLLELFKFLRHIVASPSGKLQSYLTANGYASSLLHYGNSITKEMSVNLEITTDVGKNDYSFELIFAKPNKFIFKSESYLFKPTQSRGEFNQTKKSCGEGHDEAKLPEISNPFANAITGFIRKIYMFQFHNTDQTADIRLPSPEEHRSYLMQNGENISSVLHYLSKEFPLQFKRITSALRYVFPFFEEFSFAVLNKQVQVNWKEEDYHYEFELSQASDGMLRTICLFTLLLLPDEMLPEIILIDEPELGLHPSAVGVLAELLQSLSKRKQIFICTQSIQLVDMIPLENIIVIERTGGKSTLKRPDLESLENWRAHYSNSEIWDKNLIGGRP